MMISALSARWSKKLMLMMLMMLMMMFNIMITVEASSSVSSELQIEDLSQLPECWEQAEKGDHVMM